MRLRFIFFIILGIAVFSFYKKGETEFFKGGKHIPTRNLATITVLSSNNPLKKPKPPKLKKIKNSIPIDSAQFKMKEIINVKPVSKIPAQNSQNETENKSKELNTQKESLPSQKTRLVVEKMPNFPGCESISNEQELKSCSDNKLLRYLNKNIQYPLKARHQGIQGTVFVSFIIEKNGTISNADLIRDIGGDCGKEALRVVKSMPKWNAGKQHGKAVRVRFNLPVRFQMN